MRNRHLHARLRRATATVGVAAAAVMGSALTLAPAALADDTGTTPDPADQTVEVPPPADTPPPPETPADPGSDEPADPPADDRVEETPDPAVGGETAEEPEQPTPEKRSTAAVAAAVEPDFGYNKFRVGVQIEDGRYVPDGVTTLGSQIRITETGPNVPGGEVTATCTTTLVDDVDPTTTYCESLNGDSGTPLDDFVLANFGDSVTITQITVNGGLRIVDGTKIDVPSCDPEESQNCLFNGGDILLTDAPLPPDAADDETCVDPGEPVSIDVLDNDTLRGAPLTDLEVTLDPDQGSASVTGSGDDRKIRFAPSPSFSGSDSFDYRITTDNGSADATVDVTRCPEPEAVLPDTGGGDPWVLGTGLALVVGGGALVAAGSRRRLELSVTD
ncbi:Ig-like domain-containing protein [Aeromicrobium terrae]|uniref:Ig-like domain-containing protein n=1 Tax=Aeromicrobium terrae TaxID=2498846 RepID=UPI00164EE305|nr:Ig-like domain-containing protein [Aeromicrobium terrae]